MKRVIVVALVLIFGLCLATNALAGSKEAAKKNVETVVAAINGGTDAKTINANDYDPYVFVLEEDGMLVVHPSLTGKSLKEVAPPVYEAIASSIKEGKETADYMWKGAMKHSFVQKTDSGLIVGSGYTSSKDMAKKNVETVVAAINGGTDAKTINANDYDPYVFVLEEDGMLVVHPSLTGKSLKEVAPPVYEAIANSIKEGKETADYMWKGAMKHSFVQKTDGGLIVGSGYTEE